MTIEDGADVESTVETETPKTEVEGQEVETTGDEADSPPAGEDTEKTAIQKRIDKLTRRFRESERTADQIRAENEELRKQLEAAPKQTEPLKKLADFDYDEGKYSDYLFTRAAEVARQEAQKVAKGFTDETQQSRVLETFRKKESAFADTVDDYNEVAYAESLKISPAMASEIQESEIGPEMAYYLGKNPDIALEISALSGRAVVRRMTLLEAELKAEKGKTSKTVSGAPPPPPKIPAGESKLDKDPSDMSDAEFAKWRRRQIAQRR